MTAEELKQLTDFKFECIACDDSGNIIFAIPIPGKYGEDLHYGPDSSGDTTIYDPIDVWTNAWDRYIDDLKQNKKTNKTTHYRTRKQAAKSGAITKMPNEIAIVTIKPYQNAISTINNPAAHLQPVNPELANNLNFRDGKLYFAGMDASYVDLVQYYDKRPQTVSKLDLPTLRALYSVILQDIQNISKDPQKISSLINNPQYLSHSVIIYIPDFLKMIGYKPNNSKDGINAAISKIMSYSSILGVMEESQNVRNYKSHYPVLQLIGHNDIDNTIQFSSPYINKLIMTIFQACIQTDNKGNYKMKSNGEPYLKPSHSYLIKSSITKERNKRAVEIVNIVVTLIEQAGSKGGTPKIKASTIVERHPDLNNAIINASNADKNKLLKRAFTKAWELLQKQTKLAEVYKNIQFPTTIPTASTLDSIVYEFSHDGKITSKDDT